LLVNFGLKLITFGSLLVNFGLKLVTFGLLLTNFGSLLTNFGLFPVNFGLDSTGSAHVVWNTLRDLFKAPRLTDKDSLGLG